MSSIHESLKEVFGFQEFKPGQQQVIETLIAGNSAASIFPTGAGKSLCYQLPALHEQGMTLVISPLLSLMKDQIDFLKSKNITAAKLDSGMSAEDYRSTLEAARAGQLKILLIAVERFKNERFRTQLQQMNVSLLVVDEAHCISEWGHNFRPDYLKIPIFAEEFHIEKVLLLTATATSMVIADMCAKFNIHEKNVVQTGFYRENLFLRIQPITEQKKDSELQNILAGKPHGSAVVYVTQQKTAERVAMMLKENGMPAEAYHAGMDNSRRDQIQNQFMAGKTAIVVATIAFGMGIDKKDLRKVIHYDLPKSIENYSQEIGRAGRDDKPSLCCLLGNKNGVPVLENFVYGDTPSYSNISHVLNCIDQNQGNTFEVHPYRLSRESDVRLLPLKTLLVYLEMAKIISPKYTYFESYAFLYLTTPEAIISNFNNERKHFVKTILAHSKTAKKWTTVDIDHIVEETGSDRQRVLTALEYFHEKGWITLQPKSAVEVFEILAPEFDINSVARELADLFAQKEQKEVARIHSMIQMFETDQCLAKSLSAYFGENLKNDCKRCSVCINHKPVLLPESNPPSLDNLSFSNLTQPLARAAASPLTVSQVTRFLCGISTPRLVQYKAKQMPGFKLLQSSPYKSVEKWVRRHMEKQ
ncbi:MAG: RecQ family ATP-dependent DNA helicase [Candidatus Sabulitectum sp.]|nr:RecQ family ATP-dependent DNA helicase [Candidatus Sabulitectum sp.]